MIKLILWIRFCRIISYRGTQSSEDGQILKYHQFVICMLSFVDRFIAIDI